MKLKHYFLVFLAVFAIGYTTLDRLNDAVEMMEASSIVSFAIQAADFTNPHNPFASTDEVFCDFPMIAKMLIILFSAITTFFIFRLPFSFIPHSYRQERFRPPAAVIV